MNKKNIPLLCLFLVAVGGVHLVPARAQLDLHNVNKAKNQSPCETGEGKGRGIMRPLQPREKDIRRYHVVSVGSRWIPTDIRQQLANAGYTDVALQDAVVNFFKVQEAAKTTLQEQWRIIKRAVQSHTVTQAQMATLLNDFRAAVEAEKERRDAAYRTLSETLKLSENPMLDALLMTMGVTGDESAFAGHEEPETFGGIVNAPGLGAQGGRFTIGKVF